MKRAYNKPRTLIVSLRLDTPMLAMSEGETTEVIVNPYIDKAPSEALSRHDRRSLWDDEDDEADY